MRKLLTFLLASLLSFGIGWAETVFTETFSNAAGTGGNDDSWSGNVSSKAFSSSSADNSGWSLTYAYAGDGCIRLGKSKGQGSATTPSITVTSGTTYTLTFRAGAWSDDATTLYVSATGGTLSESSVTLTSAAWTTYTLTLTATSSSATITFKGKQASKARFFLDDVVLSTDGGDTPTPGGDVTAPTASVAAGQVEYGTQVTLTADGTAGIYYTTDGTDPTESSDPIEYTGAITITGETTIKAVAYDNDMNFSDVVTYTYTVYPLTLTLTPASGTYTVGDEATVTVSTEHAYGDVMITYSIDGGTEQDYTDGITIPTTTAGTVTITVNAIDSRDGGETATATATYTIQEAGAGNVYTKVTSADQLVAGNSYILVYETTPAFMGAIGSYGASITGPTISSNTVDIDGYEILEMTLGGKEGAWTFDTGSGKYLAWSSGNSLTTLTDATSTYAQWTITASSGDYILKNVNTSSRVLQYNSNSPRFACYTSSQKVACLYVKGGTIVKAPTFSPEGGTYTSVQTVTLSQADGYDIYYSTDGTNFTKYAEGISVKENTTIYAYAQDADGNKSKTVSATYVINITVPDVTITPATGTYYENQTVTITGADGYTIYYTTDGTDPTNSNSSQPYTADKFTVNYNEGNTTTVKAAAYDEANKTWGAVTEVIYTWGSPCVNFNPGSTSTNNTSITVTLTTTPSGGTIHYSTDGGKTWETTNDGGKVTISNLDQGDVTLQAYAEVNGAKTATTSATYSYTAYTIDAPFFSPIEGTYYGDQTVMMYSTTENAVIYYTTDGSDPTTSSTRQLYDANNPPTLAATGNYTVKAVAYQGTVVSEVSSATYVINAESTSSSVVKNIYEMNYETEVGDEVTLGNNIQVVYMSTRLHDNETAEFCFVRDNSDYGLIYITPFNNVYSDMTIFKMGDWLDHNSITGTVSVWSDGFHNELGSNASYKTITSWPTSTIGWSKIIPEETTNETINNGNTAVVGGNLWAHYVHVRYNTLSDVSKGTSSSSRYGGYITDQTGVALRYYDLFFNFSGHNGQPDYGQTFFDEVQDKGGTFDVYGVVNYYKNKTPKWEIDPIDFLWIYPPTITPAGGENTEPFEATLSVENVDWSDNTPTIYYRTDDMEDWAVYIPGTTEINVSTTTTIYYYSELPAEKNNSTGVNDGYNYNDYVRSVVQSTTYTFATIADPIIKPVSSVYEAGDTLKGATVTTNSACEDGTYTIYTTDGTTPTVTIGEDGTITVGEGTTLIGPKNGEDEATVTKTLNDITTTTTVTAQSFYIAGDGSVIWSNVVTEIYTFVTSNGIIYELLKTAPKSNEIYVIVNKEYYMGMSTTQNATNRSATGVKFVDENKEKVYGNTELAQFRITQSGNYYYLYNLNGDNVGYLSVNTNDNANLLTNATTRAASITIGQESSDIDHSYAATIVFNHQGTNRTMRFYPNQHWFSTYGDATLNEDVFLYGTNATPLSTIEDTFDENSQVTVSDQLIGAWADDEKQILWAKDMAPYVSIDPSDDKRDGQIDYMREVARNWHTGESSEYLQSNEWDESNWVILDFSGINDAKPSEFLNQYIAAGSVSGKYTDATNFKIVLANKPTVVSSNDVPTGYYGYEPDPKETQHKDYAYNRYSPANFLVENLTYDGKAGAKAGTGCYVDYVDKELYFMNPKIQEIVQVNDAVWNGEYFTVAAVDLPDVNAYDIKGAFNINWSYNRPTEYQATALEVNEAYTFHVAVNRNANSSYGPNKAKAQNTTPSDFLLYPLDLSSNAKTGVEEAVVNNTDKQVESVRYYNTLGMESVEPFEGVNIVVTRYTDGTSSTVKVLK